MSTVPLSLGPLVAPGYVVHRSGLRWLCEDGYVCRPGEVIAYCSVGLKPDGSGVQGTQPFAQEARLPGGARLTHRWAGKQIRLYFSADISTS